MRLPWNNYDKPVIVHCTRERLQGHGSYWLAKKQRDAKAAVQVCEDLVGEELFYDLFDQIHEIHPRPIVVAPAMPPDETTNALGRTFSAWLARELECRTVGGIHQTNSVKRDFITDPYYRITHSPSFEGDIEAGSAYILADDLYTMGGTLACLRGFIEQRGGSVIGMTTIGEKEGGHVWISLAQSTLSALRSRYGDDLESLLQRRAGFGIDCLTEAEGLHLLREPSFDAVRAGFARTADS